MTDASIFELMIPGDMTIYEAEELQAKFSEVVDMNKSVSVNMANVAEMDSAGLQLMVSLKKTLDDKGKTLVFQNHSRAVIDLLDLMDMTTYFGDPIVLDQ